MFCFRVIHCDCCRIVQLSHCDLDIKAKNQFNKTYKSRIMTIGSHFLQYMVPIFIFDFIKSQAGIFMDDGTSFFDDGVTITWDGQKYKASKCLSLLASAFNIPAVDTQSFSHINDVWPQIIEDPMFEELFEALFLL